MRNIQYKIQGFLKGVRQLRKVAVHSSNLANTFIGYKLDEIEIQATITTQYELDNFIMFLEQLRPILGE